MSAIYLVNYGSAVPKVIASQGLTTGQQLVLVTWSPINTGYNAQWNWVNAQFLNVSDQSLCFQMKQNGDGIPVLLDAASPPTQWNTWTVGGQNPYAIRPVHDDGQNIQVPYGNLSDGTGIITGGWHQGEAWKQWQFVDALAYHTDYTQAPLVNLWNGGDLSRVLAISEANPNGQVIVETYEDAQDAQQFYMLSFGSVVLFINKHTGLALKMQQNGDGIPVVQVDLTDLDEYSFWTLGSDSNGSSAIRPVHDSGQNIQVPYGNLANGTGVITGGWNKGEDWKTWFIKPVTATSAQTYRIANAGSTNPTYVLSNDPNNSGGNLVLEASSVLTTNSVFSVAAWADGYVLLNQDTGLGARQAQSQDGSAVQQQPLANADAQTVWTFSGNPAAGAIAIRPSNDDSQNLQPPYGSLKPGQQVITGGWNKGEAWKTWKLIPYGTLDVLASTLEGLQTIIAANAPFLRLTTTEQYQPCSVDWYVDCCNLVSGHTQVQATFANMAADQNQQDYITLQNDSNQGGNFASAKAYVHVRPANDPLYANFTDVTYFFFYAYNGSGTICLGVTNLPVPYIGEHGGDWEYCTLRFDNTTKQVHSLYMAQHDSGEWIDFPLTNPGVTKKNGRIVVYSSQNGHATYASPGDHETPLGPLSLVNFCEDGGNELDCSTYELLAVDNIPGITFTPQIWLQFAGRWGAIISYNYGPLYDILVTIYLGDVFKAQEAIQSIKDAINQDEASGETGPTGPMQKGVWSGGND